jgi:hypothetical protein
MKTKIARTLQSKICMVERKEILRWFRINKTKVINDNLDIYSSCKCKRRFHKFGWNLTIETLRTCSPQKKSALQDLPNQNRTGLDLICPHHDIANLPLRRCQSHLNRRPLKRRRFFNRHQCTWYTMEGSFGKPHKPWTSTASSIPKIPSWKFCNRLA